MEHIDYLTFYSGPIIAYPINSSPPEQNGRHFAYDILKRIFLN